MPASSKHLAILIGSALLSNTGMSSTAVFAHPGSSPKSLNAKSFDTGLYAIHRIAISHDGREVAFLGYALPNGVSRQFGVSVFDVASQKILARLDVTAVRQQILQGGIAFSPNDQTLAAGVDTISIWDSATWRLKGRIDGPFTRGAYAARSLLDLKFSRDGEKVIGLYDKVWGPDDVQVDNTSDLVRLSDQVRQAYHAGDIPKLYQHSEVEVFDLKSGSRLKRIGIARPGQRGDRITMAGELEIAQDGDAAYVGLIDRDGLPSPPNPDTPPRVAIQKVDLQDGVVSGVVEQRQEWMFSAFSVGSNGDMVATGERAGTKISTVGGGWNTNDDPIRIWATSDGHLAESVGSTSTPIWKLAFLPNPRYLMSCQTGSENHEALSV